MQLSRVCRATLPLLLIGVLNSVSCASNQISTNNPSSPPIRLKLKGTVGAEDITQYYSDSQIQDYELGQKTRDREEIVEFRVKEKVVANQGGKITTVVTTISKDGTVDLHELAFPERREEIEYIFDESTAKVLKAGDYPPDTVFFVPPLPLPTEPVRVGDTWTMDHAWVGLKNGIPLMIHLIGILKKVEKCPAGTCAEIEVSGNVDVVGIKKANGDFNSRIWGRVVIAVESGTVIWSEMRSRERMVVNTQRTDVLSCMAAKLESPKAWRPPTPGKATCTPTEAPFPE